MPDGDEDLGRQPGLVELMGAEVGNLEFRERDLMRRRERLTRRLRDLDATDRRLTGEVESSRAKVGSIRVELGKQLEQLKFLEESLAAAQNRAKAVNAALAKIAGDEKRLAGLEARGKALPGLIAKAQADQRAAEGQLKALEARLQAFRSTLNKAAGELEKLAPPKKAAGKPPAKPTKKK